MCGMIPRKLPSGIVTANGPPPSTSSATRVACFASFPRRYSIFTVSPGSSARASSTSLIPGPDCSSSSEPAWTPPSAVPLNLVITSPALSPALSAGPLGVTATMRAPILSESALAAVFTTTPMRPRFSVEKL